MNCRDFQMIVLDLARNRPLDSSTRERGLAHIEGCEDCAARLAVERTLLACVRPVVAELMGEEAPAHVEKELLATFRAQRAAAISTRVWSSWRLAAFAAVILLSISVLTLFRKPAISPRPQQEERAVSSGSGSSPGPSATSPNLAALPLANNRTAARQAGKSQKRVHRRAAGNHPDNASDDAETIAVFFRLREGDDLTELESVRLVRVELPGSALREIGVAVDPETAKARFEADVMLGQDGLARAIRFVRWSSNKETTDE
jgi:hypothetical protein